MQYSLFDDEEVQPQSPFTNRIVCVLGQFTQGKGLVSRLLRLGAEVKNTPSRGVHYVLLGNDASVADLARLDDMAFHGWCPMVLRQQQVDEILNGYGAKYHVSEDITKHLKLSTKHWQQLRIDFSKSNNPLYTSEVYVCGDTVTSQREIYQQMGNHGIYANPYIDDTTDTILLSDASVKELTEGGTNEELQKIERLYNGSRSQTFRYRLTCESDLRLFFESLNG